MGSSQADREGMPPRAAPAEFERPAFDDAYERFSRETFGFYVRRTGSHERAADLNQELFLRVSESLPRFEGRCSLRTWIFLIARRVLIDDRNRRWRVMAGREVEVDVDDLGRTLELAPPAGVASLDVLLRDRLRDCIRRLGEVGRAVIVGHYFRGVTLREMTETLGLDNPSGSRGVLIAAQRKLRRCLGEGGEVGH